MVSTRTGHFVQIFKALGPVVGVEYVSVDYSRFAVSRTVSSYPSYAEDGWFGMGREQPRRRAIKYAKAYRKAGFPARVIFRGNGEVFTVTDTFIPKKAKK